MLSWMRDKLFVSRQKIGKVLFRRNTNDSAISEDRVSTSCSSATKKMLVDDTNLFSSERIKLHIIGLDGAIWSLSVPTEISVSTLKAMALSHFYNPIESPKLQQNFKLVVVSSKRVLHPDSLIQDEHLSSEEEILLVGRRIHTKEPIIPEDSHKGPTQKDISSATEHLTTRNIVKLPPQIDCAEDFQSEFRKILISLVEVAAQLLTVRPDANEIFTSIAERLETRDKIVPDRNAIRNLIDMGFAEDKVVLALRLKRNNPTEALEWLLEKGASKVDVSSSNDEVELGKTETSTEKHNIIQSVTKLLATFRSFRHKEFRPNAKALQAIIEMGFQERDVIEALRVTGNNQAAACDWLLGDRSENLQDLDIGLDPQGPIFKALLANPAIQLGLNNPRMLLAFLSILENPQSANTWLHDSEAAPVLNQIFKTYHAEKHILTVNRHVETFSQTTS